MLKNYRISILVPIGMNFKKKLEKTELLKLSKIQVSMKNRMMRHLFRNSPQFLISVQKLKRQKVSKFHDQVKIYNKITFKKTEKFYNNKILINKLQIVMIKIVKKSYKVQVRLFQTSHRIIFVSMSNRIIKTQYFNKQSGY